MWQEGIGYVRTPRCFDSAPPRPRGSLAAPANRTVARGEQHSRALGRSDGTYPVELPLDERDRAARRGAQLRRRQRQARAIPRPQRRSASLSVVRLMFIAI